MQTVPGSRCPLPFMGTGTPVPPPGWFKAPAYEEAGEHPPAAPPAVKRSPEKFLPQVHRSGFGLGKVSGGLQVLGQEFWGS